MLSTLNDGHWNILLQEFRNHLCHIYEQKMEEFNSSINQRVNLPCNLDISCVINYYNPYQFTINIPQHFTVIMIHIHRAT